MRNLSQKQLRYIGIGLIVLGVFAGLRMWWLLPVLLLGGIGGYLYNERRSEGRIGAAVQSGLWLVGLALLLMVKMVFPGVLVLAGASLLIRGREHEVDSKVVQLLTRFGVQPAGTNLPNAPIQRAQQAPVVNQPQTTPDSQSQVPGTPDAGYEAPNTGETTRL